ncbi:hypothetical protein JXA12_02135 [Candidatus Woesearchaeota archaeon]|nr:hypothetical protein [Candidatus Woesearchaeota archaeon]
MPRTKNFDRSNEHFISLEEKRIILEGYLDEKKTRQILEEVNEKAKKERSISTIGNQKRKMMEEHDTEDLQKIYGIMFGRTYSGQEQATHDNASLKSLDVTNPLSYNERIAQLTTDKEEAVYQHLLLQADNMMKMDLGGLTALEARKLDPEQKAIFDSIANGEDIDAIVIKGADIYLFSNHRKTHLLLPVHYQEDPAPAKTRQSIILDGTTATIYEDILKRKGGRVEQDRFHDLTRINFEQQDTDAKTAKKLQRSLDNIMRDSQYKTEIRVRVDNKPMYSFLHL